MTVWPNVFLVGAAKAGTTTLYEALRRHPEAFCPDIKEPNHFNTDMTQLIAERSRLLGRLEHFACVVDEEAYTALYRDAAHYKARCDCSGNYLPSVVAAGKIAERVPDARILVILRNPVERSFSEYVMHTMIGALGVSFGEAIDQFAPGLVNDADNFLARSLYAPQLQRYYDVFDREQILVLLFEELTSDAGRTMARICDHIGVSMLGRLPSHENAATTARFRALNHILYRTRIKHLIGQLAPASLKALARSLYYTDQIPMRIKAEDRAKLQAVFHDDVQKVSEMLQRDLSHWVNSPVRFAEEEGAAGNVAAAKPAVAMPACTPGR